MNKKMLLGALIGAGISMLNKKIRQQPAPSAGTPPPDFTKVPPPETGNAPGAGPSLDDILARAGKPGGSEGGQARGQQGGGGPDIFGDAASPGGGMPSGAGMGAGAGGAAVLMEMARRIFAQMQQRQQGGAPGGTPGQQSPGGGMPGGDLGEILGQIFGRAGGKFGPQDAQPQGKPGGSGGGLGGLFGFADTTASGGDQQADVMLQAMIAAAQSDGRIDESEQRNIARALEGQLEESDLEAFRKMLGQPVDVDQMLGKVQDPATAFNLYLVSAMTIDQSNAAEKSYMDKLAAKLGISEQAAQVIEQQVPHR